MKKILTLLITLILGTNLIFAQSVGINSDGSAPASSAMLDVSSTAKGFLAPRMTAAERTAITSPATGLLVYQTDAPKGYYYNSGTPASPAWVQLGSASGASQWATAGSNIYYNSGNVGIGTTTPTAKFDVSASGEALRLIGNSNYLTFYNTDNTVRTAYIQQNAGTNLDISTNGLPLILNQNGGNVGIGTTTPASKLQVYGTQTGANWAGMGAFGGASYAVILGQYNDKAYLGAHNAALDTWADLLINPGGGNVGIGTTATPLSKISAVNNNFDATTNPGYKFYGHQSSSTATVPLFHIQTAWENTVTANVFKVNTYQGEAGFNILSNGNVGIGTTTPDAPLTIATSGGVGLKINNGGDISLTAQVSGSSAILYNDGGNLQVSASAGSGAFCTGTAWNNASDSRLKRDIKPMTTYGLSTVMLLKPVTYYYKADKTNHHEVGFIAQEVQKIVPEVVSGTEGDITKGETLGLSYGNLVPVLTKAIQEQQATIEAQQKQIDELKAQNTALAGELKAEIETLKKAINGNSGIVNSEK